MAFGRRRNERQLDAELQSHLEMHTADNIRAGMSPEEARRQAGIALGGVEQAKQRYREGRRTRWLDELTQDIKFAGRMLVRDRGFALTVVMVLALGIGANAAIFSVVDALMLRPLPFHEPDRLVMIWEDASHVGHPNNTPAPGNYFSWKERSRAFTDMAATRGATANLTIDGPPELILGRRVTANFFDVLGVQPLLGRAFTDEDERTSAKVTLISHGLWQRRYNGNRDVIGKSILMSGETRTIIGVMPRNFIFRDRDRDFWTPIELSAEERANRRSHYLNVVGRIAPGATIDTARDDIARVTNDLRRELPTTNADVGSVVTPLRNDVLGDRREQLIVLMAAAVCVLLIACANVAGLLLLRVFNRRGELAVRASMGATSGRIVRQLVAEGVTLALAGAAIGLLIAPAGTQILTDLVPNGMAPLGDAILDFRVIAVTLAISLFTAVAFSLGPALHASRAPLVESLQQAGRSRLSSANISRDMLVVGQIAVAVILLVGTGLLLRTFSNLRGGELGFEPAQLLTLRTTIPLRKYAKPADRAGFFERVVSGVKALPGVANAAYVSTTPFGSIGNTSGFQIEGGDPAQRQDALVRIGTVDYLATIEAQLVDGRLLDSRDQESAPWVIVINETFAKLHWPGRSAVGHRISLSDDRMRTIVGVVRDIKERGFELESRPAVYFPTTQVAGTFFVPEVLVVRASGDLTSLVAPIRAVVASVDPEQPISAIRTMEDVLDSSIVDRKRQTTLLGVFASIAVLLASLGLYAVLAYGVVQRKQEIAVRMAVGATTGAVMRGVAFSGQRLALMGLAVGLAASWALSRTVETLLHGVTPSDPLTYAGAGTILWLVAFLACAIPALRATRVSPAALLRGN
jgi:predicted permease